MTEAKDVIISNNVGENATWDKPLKRLSKKN